jgi:hypothetical protein
MNRETPKSGSNGTEVDRASPIPPARFEEHHYSVKEIGEMWGLSADAVRKLFEGEPDVFVVAEERPRGKRSYRTMRVARSVVERVYRRRCNP